MCFVIFPCVDFLPFVFLWGLQCCRTIGSSSGGWGEPETNDFGLDELDGCQNSVALDQVSRPKIPKNPQKPNSLGVWSESATRQCFFFPQNEASPWLRKEVNLRQALALLRGGFVLGWQRLNRKKPMVSRQGGFICAFLLGFNCISDEWCYPPKKCVVLFRFHLFFLCIMIWRLGTKFDIFCLYLMWRQPGEKARKVEKRQRLKHPKSQWCRGMNVPNISSKNGVAEFNSSTICFSTIYMQSKADTQKRSRWLLVDLVFGKISQSAAPAFLLFQGSPFGLEKILCFGEPMVDPNSITPLHWLNLAVGSTPKPASLMVFLP